MCAAYVDTAERGERWKVKPLKAAAM